MDAKKAERKLSKNARALWEDMQALTAQGATEEAGRDHDRRLAELPPNQRRYLIVLLRHRAAELRDAERQAFENAWQGEMALRLIDRAAELGSLGRERDEITTEQAVAVLREHGEAAPVPEMLDLDRDFRLE